MKNLFRLLKHLKTKYILLFICIGAVYSLAYYFQIISPLYQKKLIDAIAMENRIDKLFLLMFIGAHIGIPLVTLLCNQLYSRIKIKIDNHFFFYFLKRLVNQNKSRISKWGSGQFADMLSQDVNNFTQALFNLSIFDLLFSFVQAAIVFVIVTKWSVAYGIICLGYILVSLGVSLLFSNSQAKAYNDNREASGEMYKELIDQLSNTNIIRSLSISHLIQKTLQHKYNKMQKGLLKILNKQTIPSALSEILSGIGFILILYVSFKLLLNKEITYGTLLAMISYYLIIINPVNNLVGVIQRIRFGLVSVNRLTNIEKQFVKDNGSIPSAISGQPWRNVALDELEHSFNKDKPVLNKLTINISSGITGLVGMSGEGKSTLIKAICRELTLTKGTVCIDGCDVNLLPLRYYLFKINLLLQETEIFDQEMMYNLVLQRTVVSKSDSVRIIKDYKDRYKVVISNCIKRYEKYGYKETQDWLSTLSNELTGMELLGIFRPSEIDTIVNDYSTYLKYINKNLSIVVDDISEISFEQNYVIREDLDSVIELLSLDSFSNRKLGTGGAFISGGEKQRLMLGRFLLRRNYEFVVLDEPFTSLDLITEKELISIIKRKLEGKKGILITHNINVLQNLADNFYIMEDGRITENGTHDDLMTKSGLYRDLLNTYTDNRNQIK